MKTTHFIIILCLLFVAAQNESSAQGTIELNQKWLCRSFFNPAAVGNVPYLELYAIGRQQWAGINGAPFSTIFHAHNFFPDINSGVGLSISSDMIGFYSHLNAKASYAFHIFPNRFSAISIGLSGGIASSWRDDSKIDLHDPFDPEYNPDFKSKIKPDFDFGIEYRNQRLRVGASVLHIMENSALVNDVYLGRNYYAYASARMNLSESIAIAPSFFSLVSSEWYQLEAGGMIYYKKQRSSPALKRLKEETDNTYDFLWAGIYFRWHGDIALIAGISINEHLRVGYSYDHILFGNRFSNSNSHEILLSYRIPGKSIPRYYYCEDC